MVEFDDYAPGYTAGMEHPFKRLVGRDATDFLLPKARWLVRHLAERCPELADARIRLLDYGCGTAEFLAALRRLGFRGTLTGCDTSTAMLEEAAARWTDGALPALLPVPEQRAPFADGSFEVVVLSSVLHHLGPSERGRLLADALRLLVPGGRLVVFEHNPLNPLTRWVVRHTPIDRNATLLRAGAVARELVALGASRSTTRYLLFFPPRLTALGRLERLLSRVPLGGQYVVVGEKGRG